MRANRSIQARVGDDEAFDGAAAHKVLTHDLRHVLDLHAAVPDGLGIYDHSRTMLALLEASGFVNPDAGNKTGCLYSILESGMQLALAVGGARGTSAPGLAEVGADKDVALKFRQSKTP
jgi:hypothetical protein